MRVDECLCWGCCLVVLSDACILGGLPCFFLNHNYGTCRKKEDKHGHNE